MDPIKIIVTNSDTTYLTPPPPSATLYEQPRNAIEHSDSDYTKPNITHNVTTNNNSAPKSKSSRRFNLPPLKISTNETKNTFKLPSDDDHIDVNDIQDDSQRLLLSPLLSKSLPVSRSTTSLNKRVKISPLLAAHRMESLGVTGKYYSCGEFLSEIIVNLCPWTDIPSVRFDELTIRSLIIIAHTFAKKKRDTFFVHELNNNSKSRCVIVYIKVLHVLKM